MLTLAPLAALVVLFGVMPGLLLNLIAGSVANVLRDVSSQPAIEVAPEVAAIALLAIAVYVVARVIVVANTDRRAAMDSADLAAGAGG